MAQFIRSILERHSEEASPIMCETGSMKEWRDYVLTVPLSAEEIDGCGNRLGPVEVEEGTVVCFRGMYEDMWPKPWWQRSLKGPVLIRCVLDDGNVNVEAGPELWFVLQEEACVALADYEPPPGINVHL